ncbi:PREDICTED: uncharacterized protein LOC104704742 [Camelina sativa]|uniref:Uncharacterized protein LOC104704742 n=1 Tax=Camelina sativa TaxID=90675 RepID=A0ABM0T0T2_CAMSA|nr:PREDICTED: uncharacterized protein LOC104704742 [Camelina sativa]
MADYRPIALCTVFYKIISKLMAKRLQPILQVIISENQSAFVPKRAITDNVLITHKNLHYLKTSGATVRGFMAVKTDMISYWFSSNMDKLVLRKGEFNHKEESAKETPSRPMCSFYAARSSPDFATKLSRTVYYRGLECRYTAPE